MDLQTLIEPILAGMGYELVALERAGAGLLRLYIDKPEGIVMEDCVRVSNQLTRMFLVENVDYERLEVSSPGLDRPLVRLADFERFAGQRANVKLQAPLDGRKKFNGILHGVSEEMLQLEVEGVVVNIPLVAIDSARLAPDFDTRVKKPVRGKK